MQLAELQWAFFFKPERSLYVISLFKCVLTSIYGKLKNVKNFNCVFVMMKLQLKF